MGQPDSPATAAEGRSGAAGSARSPAESVLRPVIGVLANVTVLTALLVYFGWRRSATQSERLGIAESVLDMSTRDYLLRSVRPVLVLLVGVAVAGLAWVVLDRWIVPLVRSRAEEPAREASSGRVVWVLRLLGVAWLVLPALVWLMGFLWRSLAFVLFPASIGVGVLLLLYAAHLRRLDSTADDVAERRNLALQVSAGLLAGVCLFWTAANYAQVEGVQLARQIAGNIERLPGVAVYSEGRLYLQGPGVKERILPQSDGKFQYRYAGLRLLEHTGGKYFLVSDGWTRTYGVLFVIRDDDDATRVDFIRDRR